MLPRRKLLLKLFELGDILLVMGAFAVVFWFFYGQYENMSFNEYFDRKVSLRVVLFMAGFGLSWHILFLFFNLYESKRLSTLKTEIIDLLKASALGAMILVTLSELLLFEMFKGWFVPVFWTVSTLCLIGSRLLLRQTLKKVRKSGRNLRHVLIVGTNDRAIQFAGEIRTKPDLGYHLVGFMDDPWEGLERFRLSGYPLVSDLKRVSEFLNENVVDEVVLALPLSACYQQASHVIAQCEEQGVLVRVLGSIFSPKLAQVRVEDFEGQSVMTLRTGAISTPDQILKRVMDLCITAPIVVLLLPFFGVVALVIKLASPGPVFFVQERVGLNKRRFPLYKFRTMVVDAEKKLADLEHLNEVKGAAFKISNDPRITPIGQLLRKTSIDELPQLFNVLKGEMSLVGPRPLPIRDYEGFSENWHRRRFSVRPGLTCLWQVMGRSRLSFERWMELDMEYIDNWSLELDLKILLKTIPAVLKGSGAT